MGEALNVMLERNALKFGADVAVRYPQGEVTLTWQETNAQANVLARHLQARGVGRGNQVALLIPNRPEFIIAYFAILKLGAVVVPINVKLTPGEIRYIVENSDAVGLLYDSALRETARKSLDGLSLSVIEEMAVLVAKLQEYSNSNLDLDILPDDLAEILYTSGTTGKPKGVMLTHNAVHAVASMFAYEMEIRHGDRVLNLMPLTHSAPLNLSLAGAVYAGAASILGDFLPQTLLELVSAERTTHFFGAPVAFLLAAKLPNFSSYDLTSMKYWIYGGAPMSREAVTMTQKLFPGKLVSVYGLTEAGPNGVPLYAREHPQYAGSIGRRGTVNAILKVVDENGREVTAGAAGEIIMQSCSLMQGYYKNEEATRKALKDGWLWTGDIARIDEEGYLWILDRKKDLIITGGINVYPKEVEDVLGRHPAVADAAVVGIPHPEWGETVLALLVAKPEAEISAAEIQRFCAEHLAKYKIPKVIEFTTAIPRNASGKILKHVIRDEAKQRLA